MSVTNLPAATIALVKGVFALLRTARDDPRYYERARGLVELCSVTLDVAEATLEETIKTVDAPVAVTVARDLGPRIAEFAAHGKGVRQIARILGVHPSTVSRRLRPKARCEVCNRPTRAGRYSQEQTFDAQPKADVVPIPLLSCFISKSEARRSG